MALETVSSGRWRRTSAVERFQGVPGDGLALVDREMPERFDQVRLAGAAGPAEAQVLGSAEPFQGPERVLGGGRDRGGVLVPDVEGLAGRQPGGAAAHPDRGRVAPGRFLDQQHANDFGRVPALRASGREDLRCGLAQVGQPEAAGEAFELVGQRRRRGRGERHAPKPSQARVERCSEDASRAGNAITCADCEWWWARIAASAPSSKRPASAATRSASLDGVGAVELGEIDGFGHLAPDAARAGRRGPRQPRARARPDLQERGLGRALRARDAFQRAGRFGRVVRVLDARAPRRRQPVARDLARPVRADVDDDQLVAVGAGPDLLLDQRARDGVQRRADRDRRLLADLARLAEAHRVRDRRERMQPRKLLREHQLRRALRDPVNAAVHARAERAAGVLELREGRVVGAQVVIGRDQIGLRDPDRRLRAALASADRRARTSGSRTRSGARRRRSWGF